MILDEPVYYLRVKENYVYYLDYEFKLFKKEFGSSDEELIAQNVFNFEFFDESIFVNQWDGEILNVKK